jgi:hypothetical protein
VFGSVHVTAVTGWTSVKLADSGATSSDGAEGHSPAFDSRSGRHPGPQCAAFLCGSSREVEAVWNGGEESGGNQLPLSRQQQGNSSHGAVADEVLDQVFRPGQRPGPESGNPGAPTGNGDGERYAHSRWLGQAPAQFLDKSLQHAYPSPKIVDYRMRTCPAFAGELREASSAVEEVEMRFPGTRHQPSNGHFQGSSGAGSRAANEGRVAMDTKLPTQVFYQLFGR